ncbi:MAG TPA: hypothetical protein VN107_11360 [Microbacterium sp.]|nr:hypothetical protein [Microbacterium sp.]
MSASERPVSSEPTAEEPQPVRPLQSPFTMIGDGASCTIDGTCDPA